MDKYTENQNLQIEEIDLKEFFYNLLSYWRLFVVALCVTLFVSWLVNRYSTQIYKLSTLINITESENPLAGSSVNLMFKWGGASELIQSHIAILKSRNHNRKVIDRLDLEVEYYSTGRIKMFTRYGQAPFKVVFDKSHGQILNIPFDIEFLNEGSGFELSYEAPDHFEVINFETGDKKRMKHFPIGKKYEIGEWLVNEACKFKIELESTNSLFSGDVKWYFQFSDPKRIVDHYVNTLTIEEQDDGGSLIKISMVGDNKAKIEAYLNTSIEILSEYELIEKNKLAENTIKFVDMSIQSVIDTLTKVERELETFRVENQVLDLGTEASALYDAFLKLEGDKAELVFAGKYYGYLGDYIKEREDFSSLMAPSVVGVEDPILMQLVNDLVGLSVQRNRMLYSLKGNNPALEQIRREITLLKSSLKENVKNLIRANEIRSDGINGRLTKMREKLSGLPKTEQSLINIKRKYELSSRQYDFLIEKRAEAELSMAGNLPDLQVIDEAMDYYDKPLKPKKGFNYLVGVLVGLIVPVGYIFFKDFFNNKISNKKELERISYIPVIGTIGHSSGNSNIVIQNGLKSAVAESFRIIRTNLKFVFKESENISTSKTILVTSSIGGEGKTFCAINLASIISISGSKTIIIGMDMRKPKIFNDFKLGNDVGLSDFLSGQVELKDIVMETEVNNLDFITAGPVPPNPSELLLSNKLPVLFKELKESYDYIILDTPPIALVSDALELMKYADATLYIARQNYTHKDLLHIINEQYQSKNVKNISLVFNDVVQERYGYGYNYGYSYGYNYGYGYGYYDEDEQVHVPWWKKII